MSLPSSSEEDAVDSRTKLLAQERFNKHVLAFIIRGMVPLPAIESVLFHAAMKEAIGEDKWNATGLRVLTADEFRQMLLDQFSELIRLVKEVLKRQSVVATTCDVWKTNEKTFVAVTAHWIDESTLDRFNCLLDVREICANPTGERLARILYHVHHEFDILGKVAYTTIGGGECNHSTMILLSDAILFRIPKGYP